MTTNIKWVDEERSGECSITDDFTVVVDGTAYVDHVTVHRNGTYVITVKGGPKGKAGAVKTDEPRSDGAA